LDKKSRTKKKAVRMLRQAARMTIQVTASRMSGKATGRLAADLNRYVAILERKVQENPDDPEFWNILHKAASKLVKCLRQAS